MAQGLPKRSTEAHSGIKRGELISEKPLHVQKPYKYFHLKIQFHYLFYDFGCITLTCIFYFCLKWKAWIFPSVCEMELSKYLSHFIGNKDKTAGSSQKANCLSCSCASYALWLCLRSPEQQVKVWGTRWVVQDTIPVLASLSFTWRLLLIFHF